jgi:glycosyltransferase involved in cell wall biosynthesis
LGRNARESKSELIQIGTNKDIIIHGIQTRLFDNHGFSSVKATKNFIKKIKQIKPDIIHLHNIHGYYLNIEILFNFLAKANIPVVWTLHDCWPVTGHCTHFDFIDCNKWKTGCYSCPQKTSYPGSFLFDRSRKNYQQKKELFNSVKQMVLVPVSNWLGGIIQQSYLKQYPVNVIHNGINISQFKPSINNSFRKKYDLKNSFLILGVASTWEERKGLNDFIKLSNILNNSYKIVLVGLSAKQLKTLPDTIIGIKRTESIEELVQLYSTADVFVNPTLEDNFPTTNLEAMACGTPVITYQTGGSPESVIKETGIVIKKGDIKELVKAIQTVKKQGKQKYTKECRKHIEQNFDKNDKFAEYISLYKKLLKQ